VLIQLALYVISSRRGKYHEKMSGKMLFFPKNSPFIFKIENKILFFWKNSKLSHDFSQYSA